MGEIIPFDFETNAVRVVMLDGAPVFVAADVCRALEIGKYRDAVARLDDDEGCPVVVDTLGGRQTMTAVTESGLYALIMMSRKPVAKHFRKWVTAEVLPAIRRDGFYGIAPADRADLEGKRSYYHDLPERHRATADARVAALAQIEALIANGARVGAAIAEVAEDTGIGVRTLYSYRRAVYMVPRGDWGAAMAPQWSKPRGMQADCHPEALRMFVDLRLSGGRVSDCYRRMIDEAKARGWSPVPCERTLRRAVGRLLHGPRKTRRVA